jgi:hypothetical protein
MVALLCSALLTLAAAPACNAPYFGYNDAAALYGQVEPDAAAAAAARTGATSVRLTVDWRIVEATPGARDFSAYDRLYEAAHRRGQWPLLVLAFAPPWARDPAACPGVADCTAPPSPAHDGAWAAFAAAVASRYPRLAGIEVWNEPNLRAFWGGGVDPARYTRLLTLAHDAIGAVAPQTPVVAAGLAAYAGEAGTGPGLPTADFLRGMYAAGALGHYDGLALHPYSDLQLWYGYRAITVVKEAQAAHGDRAPLWFTELNAVPRGGEPVTGADRARYLDHVLGRLRSRADARGVYVHTLFEPATAAPGSPDRAFGLISAGGRPTPAYCALAGEAACAPPRDPAQQRRWEAEDLLQAAAEAAVVVRARGERASARALHEVDPRLGERGLRGDGRPGPDADPSRIAVYPGEDGADTLLLCNASRADRSYCVYTTGPGRWTYGSGGGSVFATAGAVTTGSAVAW